MFECSLFISVHYEVSHLIIFLEIFLHYTAGEDIILALRIDLQVKHSTYPLFIFRIAVLYQGMS